MGDSRIPWLRAGYTLFGLHGDAGLKMETLAQKAGISKSSFYHHFVDLDGFVEQLLAYHLAQCRSLAAKEREAGSIDPALIYILVAYREDILFSRQLRFNRSTDQYRCTQAYNLLSRIAVTLREILPVCKSKLA